MPIAMPLTKSSQIRSPTVGVGVQQVQGGPEVRRELLMGLCVFKRTNYNRPAHRPAHKSESGAI
jgi:hypothetical protein